MKRKEPVAFLKELSVNQFVSPTVVSIEHMLPDSYRLKIKGNFEIQAMKKYLKNKFLVEENKDYVVISEL